MYFNSYLGIFFVVMIYFVFVMVNLDYVCDMYWLWKRKDEDVVKDGNIEWVEGGVKVLRKFGLGVELDREKLERLYRQYLECGIRKRDDIMYMWKFQLDFLFKIFKWQVFNKESYVVFLFFVIDLFFMERF